MLKSVTRSCSWVHSQKLTDNRWQIFCKYMREISEIAKNVNKRREPCLGFFVIASPQLFSFPFPILLERGIREKDRDWKTDLWKLCRLEDESMLRHYTAALGTVCFRWFASAELLVLRLKCLSEMSTFTASLANSAFSQTAFLHHLLSHSVCVSALERARDDGSGVIECFGSHR